MADGGEGTMQALIASRPDITVQEAKVAGPSGQDVNAHYAMDETGTAVMEMAQASGLALVLGMNDPILATSRGTGELMAAAIAHGARRIVLGVGGSASTDGGIPALDALGWSLGGVDVDVACDVDTLYCDAARRLGPQNGATRSHINVLTDRLRHARQELQSKTGIDVGGMPSSGAAGGLGGALAALGARLRPGFEVVSAATGLGAALRSADVVITGEGRLDVNSLRGKVVGGVLEASAAARRVVLVGSMASDCPPLTGTMLHVLRTKVGSDEESLRQAGQLLEQAAHQVASTLLSAPDQDSELWQPSH
jgi:glycerate kinase